MKRVFKFVAFSLVTACLIIYTMTGCGKKTVKPSSGIGSSDSAASDGASMDSNFSSGSTSIILSSSLFSSLARSSNKVVSKSQGKTSSNNTVPSTQTSGGATTPTYIPGTNFPEVYIGICEPQYQQQIAHPDQWDYVRNNADGFYTNFHLMDAVYSVEDVQQFGNLFKNKFAFIESDMSSNISQEQFYIDKLKYGGFYVPYSSLNYGWDINRQNNLKTYSLSKGQKTRYCFVQQGPWVIGGDITKSSNSQYLNWINQSDGISTDGPMGLWKTNSGNMQSGSYSMVKYAHKLGKKASVMLCPYGANQSSYKESMFLDVGIDCVKKHEDNDAEPDIWSVFEYCADIPAIPEQQNGRPYNSTTGMAYYLLKHIKGEPKTLDLFATAANGVVTGKNIFDANVSNTTQKLIISASASAGTVYRCTISAQNLSSWCDYAALLKANGLSSAWSLQLKLGNQDITNSVLNGGFVFYQDNRLNPQTTKTIDLTLTRKATGGNANMTLNLQLLPHKTSAVSDSMQIIAK